MKAQSWQVGAVKITRVVEFEVATPYREQAPYIAEARPEVLKAIPWLMPNFVTAEGEPITAVQALLVEAPGLRLVVDTCVGNDKPRRMTNQKGLKTKFLERFLKTGWTRESVNCVVCTHLHVDHVGWNTMLENDRWVPTFAHARHLIGREEFAFWNREAERDERALLHDSVQPIVDAGLVDLVETDHAITSSVRLQATPGHTPGHVSVVIESAGETAIITGDFIHHPCQMAHPDWATSFDHDRAAATSMRRVMLEALADKPTLVIGTHFAWPTAGRVRRDGTNYRFEIA